MDIEPMTSEEANEELPATADLSDLSTDQLDEALSNFDDGNMDTLNIPAVLGEQEVEAKPEEAGAPVEEPKEEAPEAESEAAPEETPKEDETPEEESVPTELDDIRTMVELSDLKRQKSDSEMERWRLLADRNAGKVAHLEQILQKAREQPAADVSGEYREPSYDEPGAERQRVAEAPPELQQELNEIRSERIARTLQQEGAAFASRNREFLEKIESQDEPTKVAFREDFNAVLAEKAEEFRDALTGTDAKLAAVSSRVAYDTAITEARIRLTERTRSATKQSREKAQAALIDQKRASAPTQGDAPQPQAAEAAADKPLHEQSDKELNALLRSMRF